MQSLGERRLPARTSRQLAERISAMRKRDSMAADKLPAAAGWQPALPEKNFTSARQNTQLAALGY